MVGKERLFYERHQIRKFEKKFGKKLTFDFFFVYTLIVGNKFTTKYIMTRRDFHNSEDYLAYIRYLMTYKSKLI